MNRRGVSYDVGRVMYGNWRPVFDPTVVHRELAIIRNDLHCNAVRICGRDIDRLMTAAEDALGQGLEVWLSPELWDKSQDETLAYITKAATSAERLRARWPDRLVLVVGGELTLFMRGIIPGRNVAERFGSPANRVFLKAGRHNAPLNAFLAKVTTAVRAAFGGPLTYASLPWEAVEWSAFDFVGVDHYRAAQIRDRYVEMLGPALSHGKPVMIMEFGSGRIGEPTPRPRGWRATSPIGARSGCTTSRSSVASSGRICVAITSETRNFRPARSPRCSACSTARASRARSS